MRCVMNRSGVQRLSSPTCATATLPGVLALGIWLVAVGGCEERDPLFCDADAQCRDRSAERYNPDTPYCNRLGNYCYDGCQQDSDCSDSGEGNSRYEGPGLPLCNPQTRHCQSGGDGGVGRRLGQVCSLGGECESGFCVDGVCCSTDSCPSCQACDQGGDAGDCSALAAGAAPSGQCPGDAACGGGQCDGLGGCAYQATDSSCGDRCSSGRQTPLRCDAEHRCVADDAAAVLCAPNLCDAAGERCRIGCRVQDECEADSACDRSQAHLDGQGVCVAPEEVVVVGRGASPSTIAAALALRDRRRVIRLSARSEPYLERITIDPDTGPTLQLIGDPGAVLKPNGNGAAIRVRDGARLVVQGLTIEGSTGNGGDGINCDGDESQGSLLVVEAVIRGNSDSGIDANDCDVTVRRSLIERNAGGGLNLEAGNFVIVNNVLRDNGASDSSIGGAGLTVQSSNTVSFFNNTFFSNEASGTGSAVKCSSALPLINSIFWGNDGVELGPDCQASYSVIEGLANPGATNLSADPRFVDSSNLQLQSGSPAIDRGQQQSQSVIDFSGGPRKVGTATDIGAYER